MATQTRPRRLRRFGVTALAGTTVLTGLALAGGTLLAERLTSGGDAARIGREWSTVPTRYVERPEGSVAYDDRGEGPLVVAVPSLGDLRQEYRFLTPRLVDAGYRVVAGGSYASLCPEEYFDVADHVIAGEAEYIWPRFCRELEAGSPKALYRELGNVKLEDSPVPRYDLLKLERYATATLQLSRGCPYRCEFCDIIVMFGRKPRYKAPEQIGRRPLRQGHEPPVGVDNVAVAGDHKALERRIDEFLAAEARVALALPRNQHHCQQGDHRQENGGADRHRQRRAVGLGWLARAGGAGSTDRRSRHPEMQHTDGDRQQKRGDPQRPSAPKLPPGQQCHRGKRGADDKQDEAVDESFPASDASAKY